MVFKFSGSINCNFFGHKQLLNFYIFCKDFTNDTISIDFYDCDFFESNLCAVLEALTYKLKKENNLEFTTDFEYLKRRFDVFFRSGYLKAHNFSVEDKQGTTLPFETFSYSIEAKERFCEYVEEKLMIHQGIPYLDPSLKEIVIDDLIEIYSNSAFHANSEDPFFVAGQYYPKEKVLKFTMVDLGQGFLPKIKIATKDEINTDIEAIAWATNNSSKMTTEKIPGGLGLKGILNYCEENNGILTINSGHGFWSSEQKGTIFSQGRTHEYPFEGSIINLTFKK